MAFIRAGDDTLISAPTGSGKTLAAFSICLDDLVRRAADDRLPDETLVVYVSPLKALTNDVRKNLEIPLGEIVDARRTPRSAGRIRTAVRTGDTTPAERARMLRKPPHVLVTTPESLYILLTAEKSRALFGNVTTVIVDEIHAVANSKRGAHLMLTLARLDALVTAGGTGSRSGSGCPRRFVRSTGSPNSSAPTPPSPTSEAAARWGSPSKFPPKNSARLPAVRCGRKSTIASRKRFWPTARRSCSFRRAG